MDFLDNYFSKIIPLIDTKSIERKMSEIAEIEKFTDFDSFENCIQYMEKGFLSIGMENDTLRFPADGEKKFHTYTSPIGFRTRSAICSIIEPESRARVLGDRAYESNTAIVGSGHTGPQGITSHVVHVKAMDDFQEKDIRGRIVYCDNLHPLTIRAQVINGGGVALISSYTENRVKDYEYVRWVNTWDSQSDGWLPTKKAALENLPGISISPKMGDYLKKCLDQGDVKSRIIVEGEYFTSELPNINAFVSGEEDEEVILTGHLFEQGIIDNASGVAIAFAVSEILQKIKKKLGIMRFRRGFRNFHGQECYGVLAVSEYYPGILKKIFANLDIDSIGQKGGTIFKGPGLFVSYNFSNYLMSLVLEKAKEITGVNFQENNTFEINCTLLADPRVGGISTCYLSQKNDGWHTSRDRYSIKELDQDILKYVTLSTAVWLYFLITAGTGEAEWLLEKYLEDIRKTLKRRIVPDTELFLILKQKEIDSLLILAEHKDRDLFEQKIQKIRKKIGYILYSKKIIIPLGNQREVEESKKLFPLSLVGGPAVNSCFHKDELKLIGNPKWDHVQVILKAWANGESSIYDITRWAIFEIGEESIEKLTLEYTLTFFKLFAKKGLVKLNLSPNNNLSLESE